MNSKRNSDSKAQLFWHSKKLLKLTLLDYLKTPTYAPSMLEESQLCQETSNWPEESEEKDSDQLVNIFN